MARSAKGKPGRGYGGCRHSHARSYDPPRRSHPRSFCNVPSSGFDCADGRYNLRHVHLEGGAGAVLSTIMASVPTFRAQVFGTKGAAELRGSESLEFTMLDGKIDHLKFPPTDIERAELEAFADAISGVAPYPISRPDILNGVAAFEAVGVSAAEERKVLLA